MNRPDVGAFMVMVDLHMKLHAEMEKLARNISVVPPRRGEDLVPIYFSVLPRKGTER